MTLKLLLSINISKKEARNFEFVASNPFLSKYI